MDILSHGLWANAAGKAVNLKKKNPVKLWITSAFGIFPDFFAFSHAFAYMFASWIFPNIPKMYHPRPGETQPPEGSSSLFISDLTHNLYNISHSLLIFFLIFGLIWLIRKRTFWEMGGWFIHIIMDIPSHSFDFYPTPFLWPLSDFKINGVRWGQGWFMITNYSLLIVTYLVIYLLNRRKSRVKHVISK